MENKIIAFAKDTEDGSVMELHLDLTHEDFQTLAAAIENGTGEAYIGVRQTEDDEDDLSFLG